jgi:hypothetical protein
MSKPRILVARAIFPDIVDRLAQHFDVESNPDDVIWSPQAGAGRASGRQGRRASPPAASAWTLPCWLPAPRLKIAANMAVGYNNFDVDAMTAAGVQGTNTPDVLTETTADFGFALLMATARRLTESEHFLRAGQVDQLALRHVCGQRHPRQHAGHHRHGPHRAGHCQARRARLWHEGDLSQPLAPGARAGSRMQGHAMSARTSCCAGRPRGAGAALQRRHRTTPLARPSSR